MTERPDGERAVTMLGQHDATLVPIGVDADGNLVILIKGETGTAEAHNVLVDDSGRLVMVAYGVTTVSGTADVKQIDSVREMQGADGETLRTLAVDAAGQLIMVPRGQGGNYLAIDSDGYMTTVIKGDDAGTLRTVALDDEGRLSAYIIDSSDAWGSFLSVGNAELAVRLGSPVIFHPSGRVVWTETWSGGLARWGTMGQGTGWSVDLVTNSWLSDGYAVKLVGGRDGIGNAQLVNSISWLPVSTIGFALAYCAPGNWNYTMFWLEGYDGTHGHNPKVRINKTAGKLQVENHLINWVDVATIPVGSLDVTDYHDLKLTANLVTHTYEKLWFRGNVYDISHISYYYSVSYESPRAHFYVTHYARAGYNDYIYIDNLVYTVAEE